MYNAHVDISYVAPKMLFIIYPYTAYILTETYPENSFFFKDTY